MALYSYKNFSLREWNSFSLRDWHIFVLEGSTPIQTPMYTPEQAAAAALLEDRCNLLPTQPFNGQIYVDQYGVKWEWSASQELWYRIGYKVNTPKANETTIGLLSAADKVLIDAIPQKGGGFGIIASPVYKTEANQDGVVHGNIHFVSNSLDIINDELSNTTIKFSINKQFLDTLCLTIYGPEGPRGETGDRGIDGVDGYNDGPAGKKGKKGKDAEKSHEFSGIKVIDTANIVDTAVVDVSFDQLNGKLTYTTTKMDVPDDDEPADMIIATPVQRYLYYPLVADDPTRFVTLDDWQLTAPLNDPLYDNPELLLIQTPSDIKPGEVIETKPVKLTTIIKKIVEQYKEKLNVIFDGWIKEAKEYVEKKDEQASKALSALAQKVAECEFSKPLEFCVGIEPNNCNPNRPPVKTDIINDPLNVNIANNPPFLSTMGPISIVAKNQSPGNITLSGSNWDVDESEIKSIMVETNSVDWDLIIYFNDSFDSSSNYPPVTLASSESGDKMILFNSTYSDESHNKSIYLKYVDNSGTNQATFTIRGLTVNA